MADAPPRRTERVGQLLFVASQAASGLATKCLEPLGLNPRSWGVLSTITESGPCTQIQLATALAIDRSAMVYLIDGLEAAGLVERLRNPDDRRAFLITLTDAGRRTQRRAADALTAAQETLLQPLSKGERDELRQLLGRIVDHALANAPEEERTEERR